MLLRDCTLFKHKNFTRFAINMKVFNYRYNSMQSDNSLLINFMFYLDYLSDPCVSDPNDRVLYPEPNGSYSGIIKLTSAGDYGANFNCSMKLVTAPGYKLYIRVNSIDIFINGTDCIDYLRVVYDGVIACE